MGQVKNKTVKNAAATIVEKFYSKLSNDFYHNKLVVRDVTQIHTKKLRNQVIGYVTRLYKRIQKGTVKSIYIKKHEEERIKKENLVPSKSVMDVDKVEVDPVTMQMIKDYCYMGNYVLPETKN
ncbi:40S ribosomal protein S17 [Tubulinosema ratisbonensis]|uniref:40S ribosomal protein S17 n=1 Tax=Tubulinosema ratisbonensis TaxID=291195 RepID=A0A437AHV1_9MICR|nr:40S ribosomal protein S17 [Tubulinosema ratisbonensis]